jgi:hypothetical protein
MEDEYPNFSNDTRSILNDSYARESIIDSTNLFGEDEDDFFDDEYNR